MPAVTRGEISDATTLPIDCSRLNKMNSAVTAIVMIIHKPTQGLNKPQPQVIH